MIDWPALRQAVVDDLDSDEPRLVLADALQSVGDPRGDLIALQCELTRLGASRTRLAHYDGPSVWLSGWLVDALETGEPARRAELRRLIDQLLEEDAGRWFDGNPRWHRVERGFVEHADADRPPHQLFDVSPTIESMAFDLSRDTDETWFADPRMSQLRQLFVYFGGPVGVRAAALHFIEHAPNLRQLGYASIDDTLAFRDIFPVTLCARLEGLGLNHVSMPPDYLPLVVESAPRLRHLAIQQHLDLPWRGLSNLEMLELDQTVLDIAAIAQLQRLRALRLREPFDSERFETGARALGDSLPELRMLDLTETPFRRFLQDLVGGSGLGALTHLGLANCALDDNALDYLIRSPLGQRLTYLSLNNNPISDRSLEGLAGLMRLRRLRMHGTQCTKSAVDRLRARLPFTEVEA